MTTDDVARLYPFMSSEDQGRVLEIFNTADALMGLASDKAAYPRDDTRSMLGQQVAQLRDSMRSMLGQRE